MRVEIWENGILVGTIEDGSLPSPAVVRTPLEVMSLLTAEEYAAAWAKAQTSPQVSRWFDLLRAAAEIRSDDPRTAQGCELAVAENILTAARVLEIFGVEVNS